MNIDIGNLYFIDQKFFELVEDETLPKNKPSDQNGKHNRPAYCAIKIDQSDYYWVIPVSSKVEKYQRLYDKTMKRYNRCDTIEFGYVLGKKNAFLIQNMFPVTKEYFINVYIDKNTNQPIELSKKLKKNLHAKANRVLSLYKIQGIKLMFTDVEKILEKLKVRPKHDFF